eukprot:sb/3473241/
MLCIEETQCPTEEGTEGEEAGELNAGMISVKIYNSKRGYVTVSDGEVALTKDEDNEDSVFQKVDVEDGGFTLSSGGLYLSQVTVDRSIRIELRQYDETDMNAFVWYTDTDAQGNDRMFVKRRNGKAFYFDFYKGSLTGWKATDKPNQKWTLEQQ